MWICFVKVNDVSPELFEKALFMLPSARQQRIRQYAVRRAAVQSLYGDIILHYLLKKIYKINNSRLTIGHHQFGKPYLIDYPYIHFNISHSGDYVMLVMAEFNVGADIQQVGDKNTKLAKHVFSQAELQQFNSLADNQKSDCFHTLWVLKESYLKWLGTGLSTDLKSVSFDIENNYQLVSSKYPVNCSFKRLPAAENGYLNAICVNNSSGNTLIETADATWLIHNFIA